MWILVLNTSQLQLEMLTGKQGSNADFCDLCIVTASKAPSVWQKLGRPGSPGVREEKAVLKKCTPKTKSICIYAGAELSKGRRCCNCEVTIVTHD